MDNDVAVAPAEGEELPNEQVNTPVVEGTGEGETTLTSEGTGDAGAPDTYADFAMPEGVEPDTAMIDLVSPIFKELGLTQDQAQKLVDFQAAQNKTGAENQVEAFNQMMTQWQTDSRSDNEIGGDKFDENVAIARTAVDKFGTPELKQLLTDHGVGNHPEMIRFMFRVGKLTREDVPGEGTNAPGNTPADRVSILYPAAKTA